MASELSAIADMLRPLALRSEMQEALGLVKQRLGSLERSAQRRLVRAARMVAVARALARRAQERLEQEAANARDGVEELMRRLQHSAAAKEGTEMGLRCAHRRRSAPACVGASA